MKRVLIVLAVALALLTAVQAGEAQRTGPLAIIEGTPDTTSAPPEVRTYVSVIDRSTAQTVEGLTAGEFRVREAGTDVPSPTVSYGPVGLAIVVVVDRGGISAPGDVRIREAADLVRELVSRLTITGSADDDMVAIVGVGEGGAMEPEEDFSYNPVDTNLVLNTLVVMEGETVRGGTPLYEGLDEALRLLTANTRATIRDVLAHRRRIIVVLSDGIDPSYSDSAREEDIIRNANAADISIYAVGLAHRNSQLSAAGNLVRLAHQTSGLYQLHNSDESHQQVLGLLDRLVTQRQQYLVSYRTRQPRGDYTLSVAVDTPTGSAEAHVTFSSILEIPQIALASPVDGLQVSVPYSRSIEGLVPTTVTLGVQVVPLDGVPRSPAGVRYFANGVLIGTGATPPAFDYAWDVSTLVTPTLVAEAQEYTLVAEADDAYLNARMASPPVTIQVGWEPAQYTFLERLLMWLRTNWWLALILAALAVGLLLLLVLLIRTRGEVARRVVRATTTGVLKGVTKVLGALPQRGPGKLVVVQGPNVGREFRLAGQLVKVGRDPQFCDIALHDDYVSNPHFSVQLDQTQFFITDEGSRNGTRVNGTPIPPRQRVRLVPDAIIEVGETRLQFRRLGGTTRQLGPLPGAGLPAGTSPSETAQWPSAGAQPGPQSRPPGSQQGG